MKSVIYRSTYKHLYLFQKTLVETGQSVMAATVPVTLQSQIDQPQQTLVATTAVPLVQTETAEEGITSNQRDP